MPVQGNGSNKGHSPKKISAGGTMNFKWFKCWGLFVILAFIMACSSSMPISTPTPLPTPSPTATFTPNPTETPTATASPTAVAFPLTQILARAPSHGEKVLEEHFDDNQQNWQAYYTNRPMTVKDGLLQMANKEKGYVALAWCMSCGDFKDAYYYQADVKLNEFSNIAYGLAFSIRDNNNYYIFNISNESSTYALFKLVNDEWDTLIDYTSTTEISDSLPNTLSVYFDHGKIDLFINGALVNSYTDSSPHSGGKIGLIVNDSGVTLYADNVLAYQAKGGTITKATCPNGAPAGQWALIINKTGSGTGTITIDGKAQSIKPGKNVIYLAANQPHKILVGTNTLNFSASECGENTLSVP